jgi:cytidine deaminase
MTDRELINRAVEAAEYAYAPYSKFAVGAAIECEDGTVVTGCNVENATLGCTICAERTAVTKAVSMGKQNFRRIAVYSSESASYCTPCGICRQVLAEFSPDMEVLSARSDGRYISLRLRELLPRMFSKDNLQ